MTIKTQQIIIFQILLLPFILLGQIDSSRCVKRALPTMNHHYFTPTSAFPSPFMTTFFKTGVGGGLSLSTVPITYNGHTLATLKGDDTYITADILFQLKAKEWLSIWFRYQANARIGSSKPTILAHGVSSTTAFEFGWMFNLIHKEKTQLSSTIFIMNSTVSTVLLTNYIKDIINNPDSDNASLAKKRNPLYVGAGLRYAHSFSDLIGLQAYFNAAYGESILKQNATIWKFDMGIMGSFDFNHRFNIPLGITLGYLAQRFTIFTNIEEDNSTSMLLKLAYTGRPDYNIGLEILNNNTTTPLLENTATLKYLTTSFVMVYYF